MTPSLTPDLSRSFVPVSESKAPGECGKEGCDQRASQGSTYSPFCSWICREDYFAAIGAGDLRDVIRKEQD